MPEHAGRLLGDPADAPCRDLRVFLVRDSVELLAKLVDGRVWLDDGAGVAGVAFGFLGGSAHANR
jgi:hypothetical protein